jgi:DNA polymerase V
VFLVPENKKYQPLEITEEMDFRVWGKVVTVLTKP